MPCAKEGCASTAHFAQLADHGIELRCRLCSAPWVETAPTPAPALAPVAPAKASAAPALSPDDVVGLARARLTVVRAEAVKHEAAAATLRLEEARLSAMVAAADSVVMPEARPN